MFRNWFRSISARPFVRLLLTYPFELLIAAWALLAGVPIAFGVHLSTNAASHLPGALFNLWGFALAASGLAVACGLCMYVLSVSDIRKIVGLRVEQCGWTMMVCSVAVFATIIVSLGVQGAVYSAMTYATLIAAGVLRISSLGKAAKAYKRVIRSVFHDS